MIPAQEYWDRKYSERPHVDANAPSAFLVRMLPRMAMGKVLDIAMGEGANAVCLAKQGFKVKGFDISGVAVEHAQRLAKEAGVTIEAQRADLDFFLLGLMEYDSIVMTYFRPSVVRYYSEMIRALKQGGTLLVESYMDQEMTEPLGREDAFKNFYFGVNELLRNLAGLHILFYHEGVDNGRHVVQCLAQRPLDKDAAKYNLFGMHTETKDAPISKQLELAEKFFKK